MSVNLNCNKKEMSQAPPFLLQIFFENPGGGARSILDHLEFEMQFLAAKKIA
jgi:hypothetical protein